MSSIMDKLRTLQGKRTPAPPSSSLPSSSQPDASGPPDVRLADMSRAPIPVQNLTAARPGNRTRLLVGAVALALAVVTVFVVFLFAGGPHGGNPPVRVASTQDAPSSEPSAPAPPDETVEVADETAETVDEAVEVADKPAEPAIAVEPREEAEVPEASDPATILANARVLEATERFDAPRFGLVETAPPPVRIVTEAEDNANKAAIRSLKVFGVLADKRGVGVYTSEGELREGCRFNGMTVAEVTSRYVVFECGNKRYRWMLPRRYAGAGADAS